MRPLDAVIARLEDQRLGVAGETIFAGSAVDLPAGDGAFLTLVETGGRRPIGAHNAGPLRRPSFQVTARAEDEAAAAALVRRAYRALGGGDHPIVNTVIGDVFMLRLRPLQQPFPLPIDAQGRVRLVFNVDALLRHQAVVVVPSWIDNASGWIDNASGWVQA